MITKASAISLFLSIASHPATAFQPSRSFTLSSRLNSDLQAKKKIFIDGEAGTTGLQVRDRLAKREDLEIISIADDLRKDAGERKRLINEADCVILCKFQLHCCTSVVFSFCRRLMFVTNQLHAGLPDDASKEVSLQIPLQAYYAIVKYEVKCNKQSCYYF